MVGWHHQLDGHKFEKAPGAGDGQGSLVCCSPWGQRELDMTYGLIDNNSMKNFNTNWRWGYSVKKLMFKS